MQQVTTSSWARPHRPSGWTLAAALLFTFAFAGTGCGPVTTASTIKDAEFDLSEARGLEAPKNAPYEYTKAAEYLHKAKELEGYGLYEQASTFARRSRLYSEKANDVARFAKERSSRRDKFGGTKKKAAAPAFTPSGGQ
jgi:hypothetical protein